MQDLFGNTRRIRSTRRTSMLQKGPSAFCIEIPKSSTSAAAGSRRVLVDIPAEPHTPCVITFPIIKKKELQRWTGSIPPAHLVIPLNTSVRPTVYRC